ncbi:cytochrome c oxidase subunit 3 [Thermus thermamylovorans]|uniref:Bb3-type cytochrome oxidase subunit IV n=1 Tax=Thermus thermamylovorans TaxID=2509362 RepID=A0A4Q9B4G3_9DEIN|nr:cytochrome c oxidase subunit 3 [Thermus thermamylovorans]TBH20465.1 bb3-type cytochrome oxidase subunit IV [Thermus thermamylovorans]
MEERTLRLPRFLAYLAQDWTSDLATFKVVWAKAMMWIFLLSDTFIFGCFLAAYAAARLSATEPWPDAGKVFALHLGGQEVPLLLIAIMTVILISSSGTMAIAVYHAYNRNKPYTALFLGLTALLGLTFVGMQAYEWTHLIKDLGFRPWGNPMGAAQFGASFFMLTGFHGLHVTAGVIYLTAVAVRVLKGVYDRAGSYVGVEVAGLYWHFVDLVWVFIFAFFYLF